MKNFRKGFTLLEILLVIGIIAVLAGVVIVAINPGRQLAQARNLERKSDLKQIDSALTQYYIDNNEYPASLISVSSLTEICDTGASTSSSELTATCSGASLIDLSELVPTYLTAIPRDPSATTTDHAGYKIIKTGKKIGLSAPAELSQVITIGTVPEVVAGCGDPTNVECWSTATSSLAWGPDVITNIQDETNGAANTTALILRETNFFESYPAAHYCDTLVENNHSDWYLPAKEQLFDGLIAYQSHFSDNSSWGGFAEGTGYWSSTEYSGNPEGRALGYIYYSYDDYVYSYYGYKDSTNFQARCIR